MAIPDWFRRAGVVRTLRKHGPRRACEVQSLERRLLMSTDVLTYRYDLQHTGVDNAETQLGTANVKPGTFGLVDTITLDGPVYAQTLVKMGVSISAGPNTTAGSVGIHNVVFAATENDSLYAIDTTTAAILWQRSFTELTSGLGLIAGTNINNPMNALSSAPVPDWVLNSNDIAPTVGITSTPVIDPSRNLMFVVVRTQEFIGNAFHYIQRLRAINLSNGTDAVSPFLIGDSINDTTNNTPIYVYGTGDGSVTDPYNHTGKKVVQFDAIRENQRSALSLVNGTVYVAWASHGDNGPYHGWIAKWDTTQLSTKGFVLTGVFNTCPNGGEAGIWEGGGGLSFEPDGSAFYVETGNGTVTGVAPVLNAQGFIADGNYYEALLKLTSDTTTTATNQDENGWGIKLIDYFVPHNVVQLDATDQDFGSGAPLVLPDSAGIPGHPHLLIAGGKEGKLYLIDRDNLGKFDPNQDHVLNVIDDGTGALSPARYLQGYLETPAYFNGHVYVVDGYNGPAESLVIGNDGSLTTSSQTAINNFGYLPGSVTISSNGGQSAIAWVLDRNADVLRAYDATTFSTELWDSGDKPADSVGSISKFSGLTVANGEVFIGNTTGLVIYGLTPPATTVPNAPVLSATPASGSTIQLTWTDSTAAPNVATVYLIEEQINGVFEQVATASANASSIEIGGLSKSTTYAFRIRSENGRGFSGYSNVAMATTSSVATGPLTPTGLGAVPASAISIKLNWTNSSTNISGFIIDRAQDANFTVALVSQLVSGDVSTFTDASPGLSPNNTYYYRIRATNSMAISGYSNTATASIPVAPPKPTNAAVTSYSNTQVTLSWTDNAGRAADGYRILRAVNHGTFSVLVTLPPVGNNPPTQETYVDHQVAGGNFYEYHIQAFNVSGWNDFSGTSATTLPNAPIIRSTTTPAGQIVVSWSAVNGAKSYIVYYGTTSGIYKSKATVTGVTSLALPGLISNTKYYFAVSATDAGGESAKSAQATATTLPKGFSDLDIGAPHLAGAVKYSAGVLSISGGGANIWNTSDQFNYLSTSTTGDQSLVARVLSVGNTNFWAKSGIMFRDTTAATSAFVAIFQNPNNEIEMQWRDVAGTTATWTGIRGYGTASVKWLRIVKSGDFFTGYYATTSTTPAPSDWNLIATHYTIFTSTNYRAGLAVTAYNNALLSTSSFSNLSLTPVGNTVLSRAGWVTSASNSAAGTSPAQAIDGNSTTAWSSASNQASGLYFQVDLGSMKTFDRLVLDSGLAVNNYPRLYAIYVSNNGTDWSSQTPIATGAVTESLHAIELPFTTARFVRIELTSSAAVPWSIAELNLYV